MRASAPRLHDRFRRRLPIFPMKRTSKSRSASQSREISHDSIAERAYHLWERDGRPQGRDQTHWYDAERELRDASDPAESRSASDAGSARRSSESRNPLGRRAATSSVEEGPSDSPEIRRTALET